MTQKEGLVKSGVTDFKVSRVWVFDFFGGLRTGFPNFEMRLAAERSTFFIIFWEITSDDF